MAAATATRVAPGAPSAPETLNARAAKAYRRGRIKDIRARMLALGLTTYAAADVIGIGRTMFYRLLEGRSDISRALGYDRWPETVLARLDAYEDAAIAARPAIEDAIAQFQLHGVNPPARLVALLNMGKPATPKKARKATGATARQQQQQKGA